VNKKLLNVLLALAMLLLAACQTTGTVEPTPNPAQVADIRVADTATATPVQELVGSTNPEEMDTTPEPPMGGDQGPAFSGPLQREKECASKYADNVELWFCTHGWRYIEILSILVDRDTNGNIYAVQGIFRGLEQWQDGGGSWGWLVTNDPVQGLCVQFPLKEPFTACSGLSAPFTGTGKVFSPNKLRAIASHKWLQENDIKFSSVVELDWLFENSKLVGVSGYFHDLSVSGNHFVRIPVGAELPTNAHCIEDGAYQYTCFDVRNFSGTAQVY
jgi:hypothetical protein